MNEVHDMIPEIGRHITQVILASTEVVPGPGLRNTDFHQVLACHVDVMSLGQLRLRYVAHGNHPRVTSTQLKNMD